MQQVLADGVLRLSALSQQRRDAPSWAWSVARFRVLHDTFTFVCYSGSDSFAAGVRDVDTGYRRSLSTCDLRLLDGHVIEPFS